MDGSAAYRIVASLVRMVVDRTTTGGVIYAVNAN